MKFYCFFTLFPIITSISVNNSIVYNSTGLNTTAAENNLYGYIKIIDHVSLPLKNILDLLKGNITREIN